MLRDRVGATTAVYVRTLFFYCIQGAVHEVVKAHDVLPLCKALDAEWVVLLIGFMIVERCVKAHLLADDGNTHDHHAVLE